MLAFDCSLIFCSGILLEERPPETPRIWPMRLERPFNPNSSARTRKALSEAIKFTVFTRSSRITARSRGLRKMDPLAPVVATVGFCGGGVGEAPPRGNANVSPQVGA